MSNSKLWFKQRRYGWGWTPITWQGWLVVAFFVLALTIIFTLLAIYAPVWVIVTTMIALLLGIFITVICYEKGPHPKWQWGNPHDH